MGIRFLREGKKKMSMANKGETIESLSYWCFYGLVIRFALGSHYLLHTIIIIYELEELYQHFPWRTSSVGRDRHPKVRKKIPKVMNDFLHEI